MEEFKQKLLKSINRAYKEELMLMGKLSGEERDETGTFKQWSAKDLIAHNAFWKLNRAQSITETLNGGAPSIANTELNKGVFEKNLNRSWDDIVKYAEKAHKTLTASVSAATHEDLTSKQVLPWQQGKPLWKIIVLYCYLHPIIHVGRYYHKRGETFYAINIWKDASVFLERLPVTPGILGTVKYNLARFYALSGQESTAEWTLKEALKLNPKLIEQSRKDPDLPTIRE